MTASLDDESAFWGDEHFSVSHSPSQDSHLREFFKNWWQDLHHNRTRNHFAVGLTFSIGGMLVGAVAAGFALSSEEALSFQRQWFNSTPWAAWLIIPLGLTGVTALTRVFFDGTAGSGIPLEMTSFMLLDNDPNIARVFSMRIMAGKFGLTLLGQACGASSGREGPTVQVASIVLLYTLRLADRLVPPVRRLLDRRDAAGRNTLRELYFREAAVVGAAAGISGAFNTPLGGIVFAVEEFGGRFTKTLGSAIVVAVAVAGVVAVWITGYHVEFEDYVECPRPRFSTYCWLVPLLAIPSGLLGGLWGQCLLLGVHMKKLSNAHLLGPYAVAIGCGLGLCSTGYWLNGSTFGSGFEEARSILEPPKVNGTVCVFSEDDLKPSAREEADKYIPSYWFLLKALATLFSYWSGIPGGIFAPTVGIGAGIGRAMYTWVIRNLSGVHLGGGVDEPLCGVICATAYFAGVTQSPITSFAILTGMFVARDNYQTAMLISAVFGWLASRAIAPSPLYSALASTRLPPLPPESLECDLRALPEPMYVSKDSSARQAHFVDVSQSRDRGGDGQQHAHERGARAATNVGAARPAAAPPDNATDPELGAARY